MYITYILYIYIYTHTYIRICIYIYLCVCITHNWRVAKCNMLVNFQTRP